MDSEWKNGDKFLQIVQKCDLYSPTDMGSMDTGNTRIVNYYGTIKPPDRVEYGFQTPMKVFLNPSGRCQFHCGGCMQNGNTAPQWEYQVASDISSQVVNLGAFQTKIGSDFTVVPFFFKMASYLVHNGIDVSTTMTGYNFDSSVTDKFRNLGIRTSVSIDGDEELSEEMRPGTYKHAMNALRLAKKEEFPLDIAFTLSRKNANQNQIKWLLETAKEYGTGIKIRFMKPVGSAEGKNLVIPHQYFRDGTIDEIRDMLEKANSEGQKINHGIFYIRDVKPMSFEHAYPGDCGIGRSMGVRADYRTHICSFLPGKYRNGGSVLKKDLLSIWLYDPNFGKVRNLARHYTTEPKYTGCIDCPVMLLHYSKTAKKLL